MEQQPFDHENNEDASKELDGCTSWIDMTNDLAWVMMPGSFDRDELNVAKAKGRAEEFVKKNYTFCAPQSQLANRKTWVYRDANNPVR
ncbi:hypothetical protein DFQ27_002471 [Actinomortierella ambigua]|uniref:Uncharacterized protein n=1 Tax=Actinomortierella ambigua TaxID=1343610 RepID=A0A9P6Q7K1_9FUNG|nr:hypothetical protein DFQ26_002128 [Actinomortierella ambigua]KAG0262244.1 hypothetical protein DFQ27_002471 [Actinomortierella ambigua]